MASCSDSPKQMPGSVRSVRLGSLSFVSFSEAFLSKKLKHLDRVSGAVFLSVQN